MAQLWAAQGRAPWAQEFLGPVGPVVTVYGTCAHSALSPARASPKAPGVHAKSSDLGEESNSFASHVTHSHTQVHTRTHMLLVVLFFSCGRN